MNSRLRIAVAAALLAATILGVVLGVWISRHPAAELASRPVLYWYDAMKPEQHFDKPGKSPYMDMALVPRYADAGDTADTVAIDPRIVQNLGIRVAEVESGQLRLSVTAAGIVRWNERKLALLQARSAGFVERVYGRAPGDIVKAGAPLVDLVIPEWTGAQAEFLALRKRADPDLIAAARLHLRLLGMSDELVARMETRGEPQAVVTITAPIAGLIQSLEVRQGMAVSAGTTLAELKGTDPVWVEADIPEALAGTIATGDAGKIMFPSNPGHTLEGTIIALLPTANADSRTVRARIELRNRDGHLRDGLFAQVNITAQPRAATALVPSESVIRSGTRSLVILALDDSHFEPVEISAGLDSGGKTQVLRGLQPGQRIVVSGQFLIDSEASLRGALTRLLPPNPRDAIPHTSSTP